MTSTENLGGCYILSGKVEGQRASVCLLEPPDDATTVAREITIRANLVRQYAADLCVLQQRLKEITEQ